MSNHSLAGTIKIMVTRPHTTVPVTIFELGHTDGPSLQRLWTAMGRAKGYSAFTAFLVCTKGRVISSRSVDYEDIEEACGTPIGAMLNPAKHHAMVPPPPATRADEIRLQ